MTRPVIVTGQQIGLLGGPLYTTYKILGAVSLARRLNGRAVFWMETNDADFQEIHTVSFMDRSHRFQALHWQKDTGGAPVGMVPVDDALVRLIHSFFEALPAASFTEALWTAALSAYRPGRTLGEASAELFHTLFGPLGVEIFDPSAVSFLKEVRPILEKACHDTPAGAQCPAFARMNGKRQALFRTTGGFALRDKSPVRLSDVILQPNRDTRPLCQDAWFGTHTYVAGPAEEVYLKALAPLYEQHGIRPAQVQPRMRAVFIEPRTRRLLQRNGWRLQDLLDKDPEQLHNELMAEAGLAPDVPTRAGQAEQRFLDAMDQLSVADSALRKAVHQAVRDALGRRRAQVKQQVANRLNDLDELVLRLKPHGNPQERVYNAFMIMNRFGGTEWIHWVLERHTFGTVTLEWTHG